MDDYRVVNNLVAPLAVPTLNLEEIEQSLTGANVFSTLDLLEGN